jgi:hypothetical protein
VYKYLVLSAVKTDILRQLGAQPIVRDVYRTTPGSGSLYRLALRLGTLHGQKYYIWSTLHGQVLHMENTTWTKVLYTENMGIDIVVINVTQVQILA